MADTLILTALSPTMETGTILNWLVKVGDKIELDQVVCEVETDKASMEYHATGEGVLLAIIKDKGDTAEVGAPLAIVGEKGEDIQNLLEQAKNSAPQSESTSDSTASKSEGSETASKTATLSPSTQMAPALRTPMLSESSRVRISPLAKKIALAQGIDYQQIKGSGPLGRIIKVDVQNYQPVLSTAATSSPLEDKIVPVTGKRAVIAQRLTQAKQMVPDYYLKASFRMDRLLQARAKINEHLKEKISVNVLLLKTLAHAIGQHPLLNTSWENDSICYHSSINIGFAVAQADGGLITPVFKNVLNTGLVTLNQEFAQLVQLARDGKLKPEQYSNGYCNVSSLSAFGVQEFNSIINPPGAAIISLASTMPTPVVNNGEIAIENVMNVVLTCDHRIIDGSQAALFLKTFQNMIEEPYFLLI